MKIKLYNYFPKRDEDGDLFWVLKILPVVEYVYSASQYGNKHTLTIGWLFWELEFQNEPYGEEV